MWMIVISTCSEDGHSTINILWEGEGDIYHDLMSTRIFTLMINNNNQMNTKKNEESGYGLDLDLLTIS